MAVSLGKDAKAYRNTGTEGTPVWDEVPNFANGRSSLNITTVDARRRASGVFHQYAAVGVDPTISWRMLFDLADTDFTVIMAAAVALTEIDMIFLSGVNSAGGHKGVRMSCCFAKFDRGEDEDDLQVVDIEAKPGIGTIPSWFTGTT